MVQLSCTWYAVPPMLPSSPVTADPPPRQRELNWVNIVFLTLTPLVGIVGTAAYVAAYGVRWWEPVLLFVGFGAVGLSIGAGYHRLFAHPSYEAHPAVQAVLLFFGSWALENSALNWSSDHRNHHRYVDTDLDPYSIKKGFWYAHLWWIFFKAPPGRSYANVPDLTANRLVMLQHRVAGPLGVITGLAVPALVGGLMGSWLGGLLWGGFLRIVLVHHTTFFVNSVAHTFGSQPYSDRCSARDSALLALVTNGEGFHNYHHAFQGDYRNGVRWYQFDPVKWLVRGLQGLGLARNLKLVPDATIEQARMRMTLKREAARLAAAPAELRTHVERAQEAWVRASIAWRDGFDRRRELRAAQAQAHAERRSLRLQKRELLAGRYRERLVELRWKWRVHSAELRGRIALRRAGYRAALQEGKDEWRRALQLLERVRA